jgi:hypothetical protein
MHDGVAAMTHLLVLPLLVLPLLVLPLLLLLLWDGKSRAGSHEEYMQGTHRQGDVQARVKQRSFPQREQSGNSAPEHA